MSIFSLEGRVLKFNTVEDIQPHLDDLDKIQDLVEVRLSGNTFGIEAGRAIAHALKKHSGLQVLYSSSFFNLHDFKAGDAQRYVYWKTQD